MYCGSTFSSEKGVGSDVFVERCEGPYPANLTLFPECSGAYIRGDYKIILGFQI